MNARKLTLAIVVALCSLGAGLALAEAARAAGCPNEASRQGPSIELPQCRVYEQVTPVDKGDAIDLFPPNGFGAEAISNDRGYAAEDGDAFLLNANASIGATAPSGRASYVFSRGAEGWSTSVVVPPINQLQEVVAEIFDPVNLSEVGFRNLAGSVADIFAGEASARQLTHEVGPVGGPYTNLSSQAGSETLSQEDEVKLVGGSVDLSHVLLESENHSLTPGATGQDAGSDALYEAVGGQLRLVNLNNEGSLMSECGATLGHGESIGAGAVSSDGSRVIFTAPEPSITEGSGCWNQATTPQENPPEIYIRVGDEKTVEISAPEPGVNDSEGMRPAVFMGASADGSKVFFMTRTELTADDTTHAPELYEYNEQPGPDEKTLTRISRGESGTMEGDVDFVGAVSPDGSTVYFAAFGKLTANAHAFSGEESEYYAPVNLYRYDTLTGTTTYITTLNQRDYPLASGGGQWPFGSGYAKEFGRNHAAIPWASAETEWYTTADGQYLVFGTNRPITGFNNTSAPGVTCRNLNNGGGEAPSACVELYRYDAESNSIVCVSCEGGAPVDNAMFARTTLNTPPGLPPRPISEDGNDVFFDTASALVPQAVPGKEHVYEWHGGTLSMISTPNDPGQAYFLGSSAEGSNVFFSTHAQLSSQDTDQSADIYDARVDGGFAGLVPPQCTGTGCQGVPAATPIFATPASVTFQGVGNFPPPPPPTVIVKPKTKTVKCAKGKHLSHGKCAKTKKKAKRASRDRRGK